VIGVPIPRIGTQKNEAAIGKPSGVKVSISDLDIIRAERRVAGNQVYAVSNGVVGDQTPTGIHRWIIFETNGGIVQVTCAGDIKTFNDLVRVLHAKLANDNLIIRIIRRIRTESNRSGGGAGDFGLEVFAVITGGNQQ